MKPFINFKTEFEKKEEKVLSIVPLAGFTPQRAPLTTTTTITKAPIHLKTERAVQQMLSTLTLRQVT